MIILRYQFVSNVNKKEENIRWRVIRFECVYFTIVTGDFALCEIKVEVLPKKISFGKPSPREPMKI